MCATIFACVFIWALHLTDLWCIYITQSRDFFLPSLLLPRRRPLAANDLRWDGARGGYGDIDLSGGRERQFLTAVVQHCTADPVLWREERWEEVRDGVSLGANYRICTNSANLLCQMCFGSVLFKPLVLKSHQRADQHFSAHLNPQNVTQNSHQFLFGLIFVTSLAASGLSLTPEFQILSYKSLAASGFYPVLFLKKPRFSQKDV